MTPFFYLLFELYLFCWYISFLHFKTFKIQFHEVLPLLYVLVCKIHRFECQRWQFQVCYGSTNKKFMFTISRFWPLKRWRWGVVVGWGGGGEWVNLLIKEHSWKNLVSDSVEWGSKKLWKMTSADVNTDVKEQFFFCLGFLSRTFTNHRTAGEGAGHFINSSLPLSPASQTLRH